jgi:glycosyltransferase involved in cell wall biosynthesis
VNVLVLSAVLPYPLLSGGQVRLYNLLKRLSQNHSVHVLSYIRSLEEQTYLKNLSFCKHIDTIYRGKALSPSYIFTSLMSNKPLLMASYDINEVKKKITEYIKTYDIDLIHIEPGYAWLGLPDVSLPIVVAEHNIEHTIYQDYIKKFTFSRYIPVFSYDVNKLKRWETIIWNTADAVITVSDQDKEYIKHHTKRPVTIVPNGIDDEWFIFKEKKRILENFTSVFIGDFRWIQNRDAVKVLLSTIWPEIVKTHAKAQLLIVGRDLPDSYRTMFDSSVTYKQYVEDIRSVFSTSDILLAPIFVGGGTKYKVLEAMASGVPVLTTTKGSEGLNAGHGKELMISDNVSAWSDIIRKLIEHPEKVSSLSKTARSFVEKHYSWKHIADIQDHVWQHTYEKA